MAPAETGAAAWRPSYVRQVLQNGGDEAPATDSRIEIELANGQRVRVGPGADMGALKRILDIADGRRP
jgi:transposase